MSKYLNEITLSIALIVLTVLFLDPFMVAMPETLVSVLIATLLIIFVIFAAFVWKERAKDERDELHVRIAGRFGYLFGAGVLVMGIVYETLTSHPDTWLVVALLAMVVGKLFGISYARSRH